MINYDDLRKPEQCDRADEWLDAELDVYQTRDVVNDAADRRDTRTAAELAQSLTEANREIATATATLAIPNISDRAHKRAKADLLRANQAKERLEARDEEGGGVDAFVGGIKTARNDAYVTMLLAAKAGLPAHRATLTP